MLLDSVTSLVKTTDSNPRRVSLMKQMLIDTVTSIANRAVAGSSPVSACTVAQLVERYVTVSLTRSVSSVIGG